MVMPHYCQVAAARFRGLAAGGRSRMRGPAAFFDILIAVGEPPIRDSLGEGGWARAL